MKRIALILFVLILVQQALVARQSTTATITGTVSDPSGAVLPGVNIQVVNEGTALTRSTVTNESGNYTVPLLPVGVYRLEAELPGFRKEIRRGITLQVDQRAREDLVLSVGQVSEVVDVTGEAPLLQTEDSAVGSVVDQQKMSELPLNGRNFESLVQLVPGAVPSPQGSHLSSRGGFVVAGMDEHMQSFFIDGYDNVDTVIRNFSYRPSLDVIEEFKVQTSGFAAEFGRNAGAVINVTTKSGTNNFHGALWEFHRNSAMDARNYFDPPNARIPGFIRNQFGGTAGGPVVHDRTFYFVAYEGLKERKAITRLGRVPPIPFRNGDFSSLGRNIIDPRTGQQFPGNVIPSSRFDPISVAVLPYWPLPNQAGTLNIVTTPSLISSFHNISGKLDHRLTTNHQLSGRYSYANEFINDPFASETGVGNRIPTFGQYVPRYRTNLGITLTSTITNRAVNEFRSSYNRFIQPQAPYFSDLLRLVGLKPEPLPPILAAIPRARNAFDTFAMSGAYESLGGGGGFLRNTQYYALSDGLSITKGNHNFKVGGDTRWMHFDNITGSPNNYSFDGRYTGETFADFLLGIPFSTSTTIGPAAGIPAREFGMDRKFEWSAYFQDDWKVAPRLTVNWGIRYEYYRPITEHNGLAGWDKDANRIQVICNKGWEVECGLPLDPAIYNVQMGAKGLYPVGLHESDRNNFAPRLGFAFRPFANGKSVIRGGYGIYYDSDDRTKSSSAKTAPFTKSMNYTSDPRVPQIQLGVNPFPTALGLQPALSSTAYDRHIRDTYAQRWNLGVQAELPGRMMFDLEYQGTLTVKAKRTRQINQPLSPGPGNPNLRRPYLPFASISYNETSGLANFHSLQGKVEKRFSRGLSFISSVLWGKAIDDRFIADSGASGSPQNGYNLRAERALSAFDIRYKWSFSYVYELPFGHGKAYLAGGPASRILGGWQVSGILTLQSGMPVTPQLAADNSNVGIRADRPNLIGNPHVDKPTPKRWYNVSAFCASAACGLAPFSYGNAGRNILSSDGIKNLDFSLTKNHRFGQERYNVQFRAEFFNVANHPNFAIPDQFVDRPTAGQVSGASTASRQIQLGLRIVY